jgi:hypothetical protein
MVFAEEDGRDCGISGSAWVGGGAAGAGPLGMLGMVAVSVTVESDVEPVPGGFEPIELCHVRDVKPLESDSRGMEG